MRKGGDKAPPFSSLKDNPDSLEFLQEKENKMKKAIIIALAMLVLSAPAMAQQFSLWADEGMTSCSVTTNPYTPFIIFVFLDPGPDGAFAAEYQLLGPAGHFSISNLKAPFVSGATIGVPFGAPGMAAPFLMCQSSLVWVWQVTCMGADPVPGVYLLEPNADSGNLGIAICPGDRPLAEATLVNHFGYNMDCVVGTEETSWGAIKSLMD
jgi:hypothetical protein